MVRLIIALVVFAAAAIVIFAYPPRILHKVWPAPGLSD